MEKKNNSLRRTVSSSVLFGFLAILLCAPNVRADLFVKSGETEDIDYNVGGYLEISGTANLYQGAYADFGIFAYPGQATNDPGSIVNIYGCAPGNSLFVLEAGTSTFNGLPPVVTIYGPRFQFGTDPSFAPPADHVINGTLNVLDESDNVLFSLWIATDQPIQLRAPDSDEEEEQEEEQERLEADLQISPNTIYRHRSKPVLFATLSLPEGVTRNDIDIDCPFWLSAGKKEMAIKACYKRMFYMRGRGRENSKVKIFAFFNVANLLQCASDDCEEMQIQVHGRLKSGREFYGKDDIRIINPPKRHWRGWMPMIKNHRHR